MWEEIVATYQGFLRVFRREDGLPWAAFLPLVAMAVTWPMLTLTMPSESEAFMVAFLLAVGLRLCLRADLTLRRLTWAITNRRVLVWAALFGPVSFALLVMQGDPMLCQRFLSAYFLLLAGLYLLDVVAGGGHMMTRYFLPGDRPAAADALLARVMAIFYLLLVLVNEAMIAGASLAGWLIYFGLLPLVVNRVGQALRRTVEQAWAKGYGRS